MQKFHFALKHENEYYSKPDVSKEDIKAIIKSALLLTTLLIYIYV